MQHEMEPLSKKPRLSIDPGQPAQAADAYQHITVKPEPGQQAHTSVEGDSRLQCQEAKKEFDIIDLISSSEDEDDGGEVQDDELPDENAEKHHSSSSDQQLGPQQEPAPPDEEDATGPGTSVSPGKSKPQCHHSHAMQHQEPDDGTYDDDEEEGDAAETGPRAAAGQQCSGSEGSNQGAGTSTAALRPEAPRSEQMANPLDEMPYLTLPNGPSAKQLTYDAHIKQHPEWEAARQGEQFAQRAFPPRGFYTISKAAHAVMMDAAKPITRGPSSSKGKKPAGPRGDGLYVLNSKRQWAPVSEKKGCIYQQIISGSREVEERVELRVISDRCHPVYLNKFGSLPNVGSDGFNLGAFTTRACKTGDLLGVYFGPVTTVAENAEQCDEDMTYATAVRRSFTFNLQWSCDLQEDDDEKQLCVLGDRAHCKMACANDPTSWVGHKDYPVPPCQQEQCRCKVYKGRKDNAQVESGLLYHMGQVLPVMFYVAKHNIAAGEEVLVSYGDWTFFQVVWHNLRNFDQWLGQERKMREQQRCIEQLQQQLAAAAGGGGPAVQQQQLQQQRVYSDRLGFQREGSVVQLGSGPTVDLAQVPGSSAATAELAELLDRVGEHVTVQEQQARSLMADKERLEAQVQQAGQQAAQLSMANAALQAAQQQLSVAEGEAAKAAALQGQLEKLQQEHANLQASSSSQRNRATKAEADLVLAQGQVAALQAKVASLAADLKASRASEQEAKRQAEKADGEREACEAELLEVQKEGEAQREAQRGLRAELAQAGDDLSEKEVQIMRLRDETDRLKAAQRDLEAKLEVKRQKITSLRAQRQEHWKEQGGGGAAGGGGGRSGHSPIVLD